MSPLTSVEDEYVQVVYEEISDHFSATRYKAWPVVSSFLNSIPKGSIGLDVGCGNGKYIKHCENEGLYIIGSDLSPSLCKLAHDDIINCINGDSLVASCLDLPHPKEKFDFVFSIAVIHHLSTRERRCEAIRIMLSRIRQSGKAFAMVWATADTKDPLNRRDFNKNQIIQTEDISTTKAGQDVLVPWNKHGKVHNRYYHLFEEKELQDLIVQAGGKILEHGFERQNWWAVFTKNGEDGSKS